MTIQTFSNRTAFINSTISFILKPNPRTIALSGGQTPIQVYKALSKKNLSKIKFYQIDERYLPQNHKDSNFKMIAKMLKPKIFHYFDTTLSIAKALKKYSRQLPKKFDLCILGIGEDGHTASLFPNSKALTSKAKVAHTQTKKFPGKNRLTLTFKTILDAKKILVFLHNKNKILAELKNPTKTPKKFPALKLLQHKNLTVHYLAE